MPALGGTFVRQHQAAGDRSRDFHLLYPCRTLLTMRGDAIAGLIQVDNYFEGFSAHSILFSVGMSNVE